MKSKKAIALMLAFTMVLTSVATYSFDNKNESANADAAYKTESEDVVNSLADAASMISYDSSSDLGTEENPFTVLEVVPYKGMGLLGYMVDGQEPINIGSLGHKSNEALLDFASTGTDSMLTYNPTAKKASIVPDDEIDEWNEPDSNYTESGFFSKTQVGKGNYTLTISYDDVNYVPNNTASTFSNNTATARASKVTTTNLAEETIGFAEPSAEQSKMAYYKDVTFAQKGSASYTVKEGLVGNKQVIFETIGEQSYSGTTYDAFLIQAYTDYYEKLNETVDDSSYYCYEPSYAYDDETGYFYYDPSAETRYYLFFCVNNEGTGLYKMSMIYDLAEGSYDGKVNAPDCYQVMDKSTYSNLIGSQNSYTVGTSYIKNVLTDNDDNITSITDGDVEVTFNYSSSTKGVKKYTAKVSSKITNYYFNRLFDELLKGNVNNEYYPMYTFRSKRYYPVAFDSVERESFIEDMKQAICDEFGLENIGYFQTLEDTDANRTKLQTALKGYRYPIFEEVTDEESLADGTYLYVVNEARQVSDEDGLVSYSACKYGSSLSIAKSSTGLYKVDVFNGTFSYNEELGNYVWNQATMDATETTDYLSNKVWIRNQPMSFYTQGAYINNNWFATKILGLSQEQAKTYKINVVTITPSELNENVGYINTANLIYVSDNYDDGSALDRMYLWEQYGKENDDSIDCTSLDDDGTVKISDQTIYKRYLNFYANDLNWDTTMSLFNRAAGMYNDYVPVVIDSSIYTETLKGNDGRYSYYWNDKIKKVSPKYDPYGDGSYSAGNGNIYKLYIMLYTKTSPLIFYNEYLKTFTDEETIEATYKITVKQGNNITMPDNLYCYYFADGIDAKCVKMTKQSNNKFYVEITNDMFSGPTGSLKLLFKDRDGDRYTTNWNATAQTSNFDVNSRGSYEYTFWWYANSGYTRGISATQTKFTAESAQTITTTRTIIQNGEYAELSGDAKKFWNELTFLPISSASENTTDNLRDQYVNEYLIPIITGKNAAKRADGWPEINTQKNVFSFNGTTKNNISSVLSTALLDSTSTTKYLAEAKDYLEDVSNYVNGSANASSPRWIDVMYYLIHAEWENLFDVEINNKATLNVLEIEPCLDFSLNGDEVRKWLPEFTGQVKVTSWISTEYIGKINDVNEDFDIIYIGTNKKLLNTDFKDDNLDNKYYVHIGDLVCSGLVSGSAYWLNYDIKATDYNGIETHYKVVNSGSSVTSTSYSSNSAVWFRYSGNDITKVKYNDLIDYVQSEFAVVLADELYAKDTSKFDTSSYIYQFAKNTVGVYDNVFKLGDLKNASGALKTRFQYYAGQTKLNIDISSSDDYIINSTSCDLSGGKNTVETSLLKYNYTIRDKDATQNDTYTVKLYADVNGDGTYTEEEEIAVDTGRKASQYANGAYTIERNLTDDFMGVLHWALVVEKQDELKHTDTVEGYMLIKNNKASKQIIRVLQIGSTVRDKNGFHMEHYTNSNGSRVTGTLSSFYEDSVVSDYYTIRCVRIDTTEFAKWYIPGSSFSYQYFDQDGNYKKVNRIGKKYSASDKSTDLLANFDMIVYGFADSVSDISNTNGAYDNIMDFVADGKALLASHDTTSMYNFNGRSNVTITEDGTSCPRGTPGIQDWDYMTGLTSSQFLRDVTGMNRFGVPTIYSIRNGISTDSYEHDTAYVANTNQTQAYKTNLGTNGGATIGSPINVAYTDFMLEFGRHGCSSYPDSSGKLMYKTTVGFTTDACNYATRVNEGQITKFPYTLGDTIDTSTTHGQYYQLNLDDPNVVVWYCLGGKKGTTGSYFDISRNDARNFFYLYSYNNVFYTGVGHDTSNASDDEKRLFINTMIAAFRATIKEPDIFVDNEESSYIDDDMKNSVIYYYSNYDPDADLEATSAFTDSDKLEIYLLPKDYNLLSDKMTIKAYVENSNGQYSVDITKEMAQSMYLVASNGDSSSKVTISDGKINVRSNYMYKYMFPMTRLNGSPDGTYRIKLIITNIKGVQSERIINIGKRSLFMLE